MNPLKKQVGGAHYKKLAIQPAEVSFVGGLINMQLVCLRYLTRNKNDVLEDLEKAYHCIELDQELFNKYADTEGLDMFCDSWENNKRKAIIDSYFSQFENGDKLKLIFNYYIDGDFIEALTLLKGYINYTINTKSRKDRLNGPFLTGDVVKRKDGGNFSNGVGTAKVTRVEKRGKVWLDTRLWIDSDSIQLAGNIK